MGSRKKPFPVFENVEITDAGSEGKAVARVDNKVIFIPFAAPGDICDIRVVRKKKSFLEGRIINIHKKSGLRTQPVCEHFGLCGGCKWQHLDYRHQLNFKQKQVEDNLTRIGKLELPPVNDILPSPATYHYRNKLEFTFSNRKWIENINDNKKNEINRNGVGFHLPGMFDRIIDLQNCYLQKSPSNEIRLSVRNFALENTFSFYDVKTWQGLLRNLIIRNTSTGEWMVIMVFNEDDKDNIDMIMAHIKNEFPWLNSLMYVINNKRNPDISDLEVRLFSGKPYILEHLDDLRFKIGPKSFFQTNSQQASALYRTAKNFADLNGSENVYDLYTGTGSIALFLARQAKKITGIEYVAASVEDARENARINNIENVSFHAGDIVHMLTPEFTQEHGLPDVVITDPPRAGMHEKVVRRIIDIAPSRIVYISCNPSTQARDLALLSPYYKIKEVQPVDMFPQTQHVENVVLLVKIDKR